MKSKESAYYFTRQFRMLSSKFSFRAFHAICIYEFGS